VVQIAHRTGIRSADAYRQRHRRLARTLHGRPRGSLNALIRPVDAAGFKMQQGDPRSWRARPRAYKGQCVHRLISELLHWRLLERQADLTEARTLFGDVRTNNWPFAFRVDELPLTPDAAKLVVRQQQVEGPFRELIVQGLAHFDLRQSRALANNHSL